MLIRPSQRWAVCTNAVVSVVLIALTTVFSSLLVGCGSGGLLATVGPDAPAPLLAKATQWHAQGDAVRHSAHGASFAAPAAGQDKPASPVPDASALSAGWLSFDDPVLSVAIERALASSASIAQASARFAQARSVLSAADSQAFPSLTGLAEFNRAAFTFGGPLAYRSQLSAGAQATWELDLFGGLARSRQAGAARLQAAAARVSALSVSLAAETANAYVSLRLCEHDAAALALVATSWQRSLDAVRAAASVGVVSGVDVANLTTRLSDAQTLASAGTAQCDKRIKAMVALLDMPEPQLRQMLLPGHARIPQPVGFSVDAVPARALQQRMDIAAAQADVLAASADIGVAQADRYPALVLSGNVIPARVSLNSGPAISVTTWALGPAVRLPLFDAGKRRAALAASQVAYESAVVELRERIRLAVSEVEQSLVDVNTTGQTLLQQRAASDAAVQALRLLTIRRLQGFSSGLDEESARREMLTTKTQLAAQSAQHAMAWIGLYRGVGGSWSTANKADNPPDQTVSDAIGSTP